MTAREQGLVLIGALLVGSLIFQIQMKLFATEIAPILARSDMSVADKAGRLIVASVAWRPLLIFMLAATLFVVWLVALTKLELSVALPLASIALVINAVGGGLIMGEALSLLR